MWLAFRRAQIIFMIYQLQRGMKGFSKLSMSSRIRKLLADPHYSNRLNECFARGQISDVLQIASLEQEVEWRKEHHRHVEFEIELAKCRLAFTNQREDDRLQSAKMYMEMARPDGVVGLSIGGRFKNYKDRAAYLLAARWLRPDLLEFQEDVLSKLSTDKPQLESIKDFCMQVRAIAQVLKCPGDKELERWTGLGAAPLCEIPPIPSEVIENWIQKHHRPSEETAVGKRGRQQPVT